MASTTLISSAAGPAASARSVFVPITPCRIMDTRPAPDNVGVRTSPLGAVDTHTINVRGVNGNCTIPTVAVGLSMNVTIANPTASSFLTVFPRTSTDLLHPISTGLPAQAPTPNAVTTNISPDGKISFFNLAGSVDVLADIIGYYAPAPGHTVPVDVFTAVDITNIGSPSPGMAFGILIGDTTPPPIFGTLRRATRHALAVDNDLGCLLSGPRRPLFLHSHARLLLGRVASSVIVPTPVPTAWHALDRRRCAPGAWYTPHDRNGQFPPRLSGTRWRV